MLEPVLQNPWVRAGGVLLALVLAGVLVYLLNFVLIPLFLAFLVAYVFDPVADYFEARAVPRIAVALGLATIALVLFISVPLIGIPMVINEAEDLVRNARTENRDQWADTLFESQAVQTLVRKMGWADDVLRDQTSLPVVAPDGAVILPEEESGVAGVAIVADVPGAPADNTVAGPADPDLPGDPEAHPAEDTGAPPPAIGATDDINERAILAAKIREWVEDRIVAFLKTHTQELVVVGQRAGTTVAGLFAGVGNRIIEFILFIGNFVLFGVVAIYLLSDFDHVIATMDDLIPPRHRNYVREMMHRIDLQLRGFLRGQGIVCLGLGVMYLVGFLISGVPFAVPLAIFGGVASFVPYLGFILTVGPALFLTLLEYGFDWHLLGVVGTFVVAQAIEGNLLTPKVMGAQVGLGPVWVILAIMVFSGALGFLGLLLAVPTAAVLKVLVVEAVRCYKESSLYQREASADRRPPGAP